MRRLSMAQERILIDGWGDVQPTQFDYEFATTSTDDSTRAMSGTAFITPLFTAESFSVSYDHLTISQCSAILHRIVQRPGKPFFNLRYFSPYYGSWQTAEFYVGQGSLKIKTLKDGDEKIQQITCNFVGRNKLT